VRHPKKTKKVIKREFLFYFLQAAQEDSLGGDEKASTLSIRRIEKEEIPKVQYIKLITLGGWQGLSAPSLDVTGANKQDGKQKSCDCLIDLMSVSDEGRYPKTYQGAGEQEPKVW